MVLILIVLVAILVILRKVQDRHNHFQLFTRLGIPGPKPSLWTGNLNEIRQPNKTPMEVMDNWRKTYGDTYGYFAGKRPMLVLHDLEQLRQVLIKEGSKGCINRPKLVVEMEPISKTVVGLRDDRWRQVRSILSTAFSTSNMRLMLSNMNSCIQTTIDILEENKGRALDASSLFRGLTCDVIARCALAMKVNSQRDISDPFYSSVKGFLKTALSPTVRLALCWPSLGKLAEFLGKLFGYEHEMTRLIIQSVKIAMTARQNRNDDEQRDFDVLEIMTQAISPSTGTGLTEEEIIANAWVFILGGFETTAAALTFTSHLLSQHQDIQERLWKEIHDAIPEGEFLTYDNVQNIKYLDQVINESLRLYPPVVTFISRQVEEPLIVKGLNIPPTVNIQIPLWQIHHDPLHWPDPYSFQPERFNKASDIKSMSYIPFGAGPRSCPALRFANMEIKLALVNIIRNFQILPHEIGNKDVKLLVDTVSISPVNGIHLRFIPRQKLNP